MDRNISWLKLFGTIFILLSLQATLATCFNPDSISLKSREFTPKESSDFSEQELNSFTTHAASQRKHVLIQFKNIPTDKAREKMKGRGIKLLSYIPNKAWFASVPSNKISSFSQDQKINFIGKVMPEDKISPSIRNNGPSKRSLNQDGTVKLTALFFKDVSHQDIRNLVDNYGSVVHEPRLGDTWTIKIPRDQINDFADNDIVKWINNIPPEPTTHNNVSRDLIEVDVAQSAPYNLSGDGFTAAEWDAGWAGEHEDLNYTVGNFSKLIIGDKGGGCDSNCSVNDHPTHVAGTMLGNGTLDNTYRGMAPDARLATYEWPDSDDELYSETNDSINSYDSILSQNSWGYTSSYGEYELLAPEYDDIISKNASAVEGTLSVIFAAGNERNGGTAYNTIPPPSTAKDIITVGAVNDSKDMTWFSSWGPTDDGRIKPDVVADGGHGVSGATESDIRSTLPTDSYGELHGTSMAAPAVSGAVILLQESYNNTHEEIASPATIKNLLIHTAEDLNNTGPDYTTGWGLVNATKAVDYIKGNTENSIVTENLSDTNDTDEYTFSLPEGKDEFKATMVWSDYPGTANADPALVNDLDLIVKNSTGDRKHPWTLNSSNPSAPAEKNREDHTNPVEQVQVDNPNSGTWTVTVNGSLNGSISISGQDYSLIINTDISPNLSIDHPENKAYDAENLSLNYSIEGFANDTCWYNHTFPNETTQRTNLTSCSNTNLTNLAEGNHTVELFSNNTEGTVYSDSVDFTIDRSAPIVNITSIQKGSAYKNTSLSLKYTATDNYTSVDTCWYNLTYNGTTNRKDLPNCSDTTLENQSEGHYNITLYSNDTLSHLGSNKIEYTVDRTPPKLNLTNPENTTYTDKTQLTLNWTTNDSLSSIDEQAYWRDHESKQTVNESNTSANITNLKTGTHTLSLSIIDFAGNFNQTSVEFKINNLMNVTNETQNTIDQIGSKNLTSFTISNATTEEITGKAYLNQTLNMTMNVNSSGKNHTVKINNLDGLEQNWNYNDHSNLSIETDPASNSAANVENSTGAKVKELTLFKEMNKFLRSFSQGSQITLNKTMEEYTPIYISDDIGNETQTMQQCEDNTAPNTTINESNTCYTTNTTTNKTTLHIPHLSGIALVNHPPNIQINNPKDQEEDLPLNTTLNITMTDVENDTMNVTFYKASDDTTICDKTTNVSNGSDVTCTWSNLDYNTNYTWYVNATDGKDTTQSTTWNFTTRTIQLIELNNPNGTGVPTSTTLNVTADHGENKTMNVTFYNASNNTEICNKTNIPNGTDVTCEWNYLENDETYTWYVNSTDGTNTVKSDEWNFTTNNPPSITLEHPENGEDGISTSPELNASVEDPENDTMNVTFYDSDDNEIGIDTGLNSGEEASVEWSSLGNGNTYEWYVEATDGKDTTQTSTSEFTTEESDDDSTDGGGGGSGSGTDDDQEYTGSAVTTETTVNYPSTGEIQIEVTNDRTTSRILMESNIEVNETGEYKYFNITYPESLTIEAGSSKNLNIELSTYEHVKPGEHTVQVNIPVLDFNENFTATITEPELQDGETDVQKYIEINKDETETRYTTKARNKKNNPVNATITDEISKNIVDSTDDITFQQEPEIIKKDPEFKWSTEINSNGEKEFTYTIDKDTRGEEWTEPTLEYTEISSEDEENQTQEPSVTQQGNETEKTEDEATAGGFNKLIIVAVVIAVMGVLIGLIIFFGRESEEEKGLKEASRKEKTGKGEKNSSKDKSQFTRKY